MKKRCRWKCKRGPHIPHHKESICLMITHTASYPSGLFPKVYTKEPATRGSFLQDLFFAILFVLRTFFLFIMSCQTDSHFTPVGWTPVVLPGAFSYEKGWVHRPSRFLWNFRLNGLNLWGFLHKVIK